MPDSFAGPRFKLARADAQRQCLYDELVQFVKDHPNPVTPEVDPKDPDSVIFYADVGEPFPEIYSIVLGEIIHNLRSALDQTVYVLARRKTKRPDRKTGFPIFVERGRYEPEGLPQVRHLTDVQRALIEGLQPYHSGKDAKSSTLAVLSDLNNTDKHRSIPIIRAFTELDRVHLTTDGQLAQFTTKRIGDGVVTRDHTPVFRMTFAAQTDAGAEVKMEAFSATAIQFGEGSTRARGLSVPDMLVEFVDLIRGIVDMFDP